jgi:hypothetical protein
MLKRLLITTLACVLACGAAFSATRAAVAAPVCGTTSHTSINGILTTSDGEAVKADASNQSTGTAALTAQGVQVQLKDTLSKLLWLNPVATKVTLADVTNLSYSVTQEQAASTVLPSMQLVIDPNPTVAADVPGVHFATLVYEPYVNGYSVAKSTAHVYSGAEAPQKWWSTKPAATALLPSGGGQANPDTWGDIVAKYPGAVVKSYGWSFGKMGGAPATPVAQLATVSTLRFATDTSCARHTWAAPVTAPVYTGPATRKNPLIEGRNWDHTHVGWIKPFHSSFEAELVADYTNVAPAGTTARTAQVKKLADRNASHTNGHGAPGQPLVFLLPTL